MAKVVVMNVDDWLGVGCILAGITAFAVSIVTLNNRKNCTLSDHYKLDTALMWGSLFLSLGSFVPQLVKNEQLKSDMDDSISLFVPIIGPLIILTRVPSTIDLFRESRKAQSETVTKLSVANQFAVFVLFLTWLAQYAQYTQRPVVSIIMWVALGVYSAMGIAVAIRLKTVIDEEKKKEGNQVYMLFSGTAETAF